MSGRYPAFIQAYGKEAWNSAPSSPIRGADVDHAESLVIAELDDEFFHVRFEKATDRERHYMTAMANLGEGPYRTADVAARLNRQPSYTSAQRDSLIKKGLIYTPDYGQVISPSPGSRNSCAGATHWGTGCRAPTRGSRSRRSRSCAVWPRSSTRTRRSACGAGCHGIR